MVTIEDAKQMTVNDLKKELKHRGATTEGKKAELFERLVDLIKEEEEKSKETTAFPSKAEENIPEVENKDTNNDEAPLVKAELSTEDSLKRDVENVQEKLEVPGPIENKEELIQTIATPLTEIQVSRSESEVKLIETTDQSNTQVESQPIEPTEPTTLPTQPSLSLNEKIKQNMKKRKEQENSEVSNSLSTQSSQPTSKPSSQAEEKTTHIRVDNFQRPLNVKNLVKWLSDILQISVTEDKIWFNFIKTHCYIDFQSIEDAEICISKVTGLKYPNTSTAILSAHFTTVSVADAPTSTEASLKPGEWLKYKTMNNDSNQSNNEGTLLGKRKSEDVKLGGANIFKRAAVTAFQTNITTSTPKSTNTSSRLVQPLGSSFMATKEVDSRQKELPGQKSLDERFRKTKTLPSISWLPVEESVAERRRNLHNRLGKK
eukprot:gene14154-15650_t